MHVTMIADDSYLTQPVLFHLANDSYLIQLVLFHLCKITGIAIIKCIFVFDVDSFLMVFDLLIMISCWLNSDQDRSGNRYEI